MNFPKIPITSVTSDISIELKSLIKTSSFSDEDIYSWAVDAARQIYTSVYDTEEVYLTVNKHTAILPKAFYLLDEIYLCEPASLKYTESELPPNQEPMRWIKSTVLRPADSATARYCTKNCINPSKSRVDMSYTIKIPPGMARFSFHTGKVYMRCFVMAKDESGVVLMQDEINGILAVKNYVKMMLLEEKFMMGEIAQNIYATFKQGWEDYLGNAQRILKFPSAADTDYLALKQDQRFRKFRYKDQ